MRAIKAARRSRSSFQTLNRNFIIGWQCIVEGQTRKASVFVLSLPTNRRKRRFWRCLRRRNGYFIPNMDISVLVVTYNSSAYIAECLGSAFKQTGIQFEVIVVDNASTNNTLARLKGLDVQLITSKENLGFGRGVNLGFTSPRGAIFTCLTRTPGCRHFGARQLVPGHGLPSAMGHGGAQSLVG